MGKGFKGNCHSCGVKGHSKGECPKGKGKGVNSMEEEQEGMNLGGGDEEPKAGEAPAMAIQVQEMQAGPEDTEYQGWGNARYFPQGFGNTMDSMH